MHKNLLVSDKELISLYSELKSCKKVAEIAWKTKNTSAVHKRLKDLNVNTSIKGRTIKTFLISDLEMVNMYLSGKTLREIAEVAESSKGLMSVRKRLLSLGVNTAYDGSKYSLKLSKAFKKYKLDETVFDIIDTEEKAYWLGFLMADGYNHESKAAVALRLLERDLEILEKYLKFLKTDTPIYTYERRNERWLNLVELNINSIHLSSALALLGCVQGKTYTLEFPKLIPKCLYNHFIRGYFDGDGCLCIKPRLDRPTGHSYKYQFTITGRKEFIEVVLDIIVANTGIKKNALRIQSNNFAQTIHYASHYTVKKITDYLYKDATIYMERKHNLYLQYLQENNGNSAE